MGNDEIIVFAGKRSFWSKFFAAASFTFGLVCIYQLIVNFDLNTVGWASTIAWSLIAFGSFLVGIYFSRVLKIEIDLGKRRYKAQTKNLLGVKDHPWRKFDLVEYVAIKKVRKNVFKVNIWFNNTKRCLSVKFNSYVAAQAFAHKAKKTLKTNILDYTLGRENR